jgi:hypothetical protein
MFMEHPPSATIMVVVGGRAWSAGQNARFWRAHIMDTHMDTHMDTRDENPRYDAGNRREIAVIV